MFLVGTAIENVVKASLVTFIAPLNTWNCPDTLDKAVLKFSPTSSVGIVTFSLVKTPLSESSPSSPSRPSDPLNKDHS